MATRIALARAAAAVDSVVDALDVGTLNAAGYINIYTGTQPADVATAATGTLLATLPLSAPAFGAATVANPSVATANAITSDTAADASGTAGWFRAFSRDNVATIDGSISTTAAATGDMLLDDTNIVAGGTVAVTSWTVQMNAH